MTSLSTGQPGFGSRLFMSGALSFLVAGGLPALYGVTLPVWSEMFGLGEGEGGMLLAAHGAGSFLAVLAGLFGLPGLGMRTGLTGIGLGAVLLSLAGGWGAALLGAFVAGLGFGLLTAAVNRSFLAGFGPRGPGMVGLVNAIYGLGAILSPLLFLVAAGRPAAVFAGMAALAGVALGLTRREAAPLARGLPDLRQRRLLIIGFIFFNGLIEGASVGFGASALVDAGLAAPTAARLTSAFFTAYLLSRLSLYWVSRHVSADRLFLLGVGGTGCAMALAGLGAPAFGYVLAGGFVGMIFPSFYVWAMGQLGHDARMTSAILTAALLGGALSPLAIRPILATTGEDGVFWIVAVAGLGLAGAFAIFRLRQAASTTTLKLGHVRG